MRLKQTLLKIPEFRPKHLTHLMDKILVKLYEGLMDKILVKLYEGSPTLSADASFVGAVYALPSIVT